MRLQLTDATFQELMQQNQMVPAATALTPASSAPAMGVSAKVAHVGKVIQRFLHFGYFTIAILKLQLEQELEVMTEHLIPSVNMNFMLSGGIYTTFEQLPHSITLPENTHNILYTNDFSGNHIFPKGKLLHNVHISLAPSYFAELCPADGKISDRLLGHIDLGRPTLASPLHGIITRQMEQALQSLVLCPFTGTVQKLYLEAKVLELLALQLDQLEQAQRIRPATSTTADVQLAEELRAYLQANYLTLPSLRVLAKTFGTNEFRLKKVFRERFESGIFTYAQVLRLEHGKKLLLEGGSSVAEIAEQIGYSHANHFSNAFRKQFGVPPTQLKK